MCICLGNMDSSLRRAAGSNYQLQSIEDQTPFAWFAEMFSSILVW